MAGPDGVILRDGREMSMRIVQVDNSRILYKNSGKKNDTEMWLDLHEVYMIRFEQRGNIYITADCKRITGENQKIEKNATVIYLVAGKEIPGYDVQVSERKVAYYTTNKRKFRALVELPYSDVFLIKYPDGTKDVLNSVVLPPEDGESKPALAAEETPAEASVAEEAATETEKLQVVFHSVKKGDTLKSIATRYNVDAQDIIHWNDLPANTRLNTSLRADMQLMLYVKPSN